MKIEIDIFSDPICPWCYIGKKRLEKALAKRPEIDVTIHWRAFQLNPTMPTDGIDRKTYLENKFGGSGGAAQVYGHINNTGIQEGIDFNFDAIERTPNTIKAHRLIRLIQDTSLEMATKFKEALFEAYFLNGQDIGDTNTLLNILDSIDLEPKDYEVFLDGVTYKKEVQEEDATARRLGITGVPFFIVNGQYALSGAQEPAAFDPIFDLALQNTTAEPTE